MAKILLNCKNCEKNISLDKREHDRHVKKGRDYFFCGLSCSTSFRNKNLSQETRQEISKKLSDKWKDNKYGIGNANNKKGDFTWFLNRARQRKKEMDIDEDHLKSIWTGFCAISNVPIEMKHYKNKTFLTTASLDRIDSSKGYIKGNVQFVAYGMNLAKNNFTDDELKSFITLIRQH